MIDWVTAQVALNYNGDITGGRLLSVDRDGSVDWVKDRWREVGGSYASKFMVQGPDDSLAKGCRLWISGNPSKFLQGHNLFGCDDIRYLVGRVMDRIAGELGVLPSENDRGSWYGGWFMLSRVDVTRSYQVGGPDRVKDWLASASQVVHSRYQSAGNEHGTTLYVGKKSRRVSLKVYDKLSELQVRGHGLADTLPADYHRWLTDFASGLLRVEATFRSMWLKDEKLVLGRSWTPKVAEVLLNERLESLEMNDTMKLTDEYVGELPGRLALVYEAWRNGRDLRGMYSKAQFYRYRSELLKHGIDIAHVRPREVVTENQYLMGAPLKSFISGPGVAVPDWARGTGMLVEVPDWFREWHARPVFASAS